MGKNVTPESIAESMDKIVDVRCPPDTLYILSREEYERWKSPDNDGEEVCNG